MLTVSSSWIALFVFSTIAYAISNIIVHSKLFKGLRFYATKHSPNVLGVILSCMMCISPWVGFIMSIIFTSVSWFAPHVALGGSFGPLAIFFDGMFVGGIVWFTHTVQEFFERGFVKDVIESENDSEDDKPNLLLD